MSLESVYITILFRTAAGCALDKMECCPICTANISAKKNYNIYSSDSEAKLVGFACGYAYFNLAQ